MPGSKPGHDGGESAPANSDSLVKEPARTRVIARWFAVAGAPSVSVSPILLPMRGAERRKARNNWARLRGVPARLALTCEAGTSRARLSALHLRNFSLRAAFQGTGRGGNVPRRQAPHPASSSRCGHGAARAVPRNARAWVQIHARASAPTVAGSLRHPVPVSIGLLSPRLRPSCQTSMPLEWHPSADVARVIVMRLGRPVKRKRPNQTELSS